MAIITCRECGGEVSNRAKHCPRCGAKPKRRTSRILLAALAVVIFAVYLNVSLNGKTSETRTPQPAMLTTVAKADIEAEAAKARAKREEADREHERHTRMAVAKDAVIAKLRDPDSAKFSDLFVNHNPGKTLVVCGKVNAKNSFGGYTGDKLFISAGKPDVTWMEGDLADFANLWNNLCYTEPPTTKK